MSANSIRRRPELVPLRFRIPLVGRWLRRRWVRAMTVPHSDGTVCMAGVWEQSAKLLQARAEEAEAIVADLWEFIPPQEPSPEFRAKVEALIARLEKKQSGKAE